VAGPASILAWLGLLVVSGLLAAVFAALGARRPSRAGAAGYAGLAFGPTVRRAVAGCFLAGVVLGAPVVCLIGAGYVAALVGGGGRTTTGVAALLLLAVIGLTLGGTRVSGTLQLVLVAVLTALVVLAVAGSLPAAQAQHWTPFAPHGWAAVGTAASVLMLSFVGWEAISPMTARLRSPRRQLPRVIWSAFALTTALYLALAVATVAVLGPAAGSPTPVADLLRVAIGPLGAAAAATAAVALCLAATNAHLSGAAEMLDAIRATPARRTGAGLQVAVAAVGLVLLGLTGLGRLDTAQLVGLPTTMFLVVYLVSTAAGVRLLTGPVRLAAAASCAAIAGILCFSGVGLAAAAVVVVVAVLPRRRPLRPEGLPAGASMPV
jgi:amino acid efflux transporter